MPLDAVLDEAAALRADADRIVARFVGLFMQFVWDPFVAAGMPADQLPRITELIESLRPVATNSVVPYLALAMQRQVNAAVGEGLVRDAPGSDTAAASEVAGRPVAGRPVAATRSSPPDRRHPIAATRSPSRYGVIRDGFANPRRLLRVSRRGARRGCQKWSRTASVPR